MNYKKSLKKLRQYHYKWWNVTIIVIFFPLVWLMSWLCSKIFLGYLFNYKRSGTTKKGIELNSYEHLLDDLANKKVSEFDIEKDQIREFNIGKLSEQISALIVRNKKSTKWVIGLHGFKRNKYIGLRNVYHFYKQGYNIITFDGYAHGKSYGVKSDFGVTNAKLLNEVISWVKNSFEVSEIGVLGVSMGAASSLQFVNTYYKDNKIDWLIADCGFSNAVHQIRFFLQKYLLIPWWLMSLGINKNMRKKTKTNIKEVNLLKLDQSISDLRILFIHGKQDDFIMYHNSVVMYYLKTNQEPEHKSYIKIYDNAKHSSSMHMNLNDYHKLTLNFINKKMVS
ncbi:alpha/beta hydrolase [Spiroplasma culicicola]|uniref:Hydrolase n=1 Tax=Spiroplasma culicicola AES-1 TaxID=1276246 RepID=W6A8Y7_9MOLU|nr:alpha/beta hydrolase [Spiroplasma culicicola]AHI53355.1 hydrolase [Spiroplasma culicicola AES-1]